MDFGSNRYVRSLEDQYKSLIMDEIDSLGDSQHFISVISDKLEAIIGESDPFWQEVDRKLDSL